MYEENIHGDKLEINSEI